MSYDVYRGRIDLKKERYATPGIVMKNVPSSEWHLVKSCENLSDAYEELSHHSCIVEGITGIVYYVTEYFVVEDTKEKGKVWLKSAEGLYTLPKRFAMKIGALATRFATKIVILALALMVFFVISKVYGALYNSGITDILENISIIAAIVFVIGVFIYGCIDNIRKRKK